MKEKSEKGYFYLLFSLKDKRTYSGSTSNLEKRIIEHNKGKNIATRNRRPLQLIYSEEFDNLEKARLREKYLKSRRGRKELKEIFKNINLNGA